jgi:hypothetical protein
VLDAEGARRRVPAARRGEELMALLLSIAYAALALLALLTGTVAMSVVVRLCIRGPRAAGEAYRRGASIPRWFRAELPPGDADQTLALAGRRSRDFGTVMVEERASRPSYG